MKHIVFLLMILAVTCLTAQDMSLITNLRHSSVDQEGNLHILFNSMDETFQSFEVFHSTGGAWTPQDAVPTGMGEFQALIPYSWGQTLDYRVTTRMEYEGENFAYLHGAYLPEATFPPQLNRLAYIGADPAGDSIMVYAPALDLTDAYVGFNDTKLIRGLRNSANAFPTLNSITSYNVYMSLIINPEAIADSVAFGMIYSFNIPGVLTPGLYKIGSDPNGMPVFTRLGNIQSQVSSGTLFLSCNFADLAADPQFGPWPNMTSSLMLTDATLRLDLDLGTMQPSFSFGDNGYVAIGEMIRHYYQVSQNTLPTVEWVTFSPTSSEYLISYTDQDQDCPLLARLQLDDTGMNFIDLIPSYMDVVNGTYQYIGSVPAEGGYYFQFSDNNLDIVILEPYVANQDVVVPAVSGIGCSIQNPLKLHSGAIPLNLTGLTKSPVRISAYNIRGQELGVKSDFVPRNATETIGLSLGNDLGIKSSGVYILRISQGSRITNHKILVTK